MSVPESFDAPTGTVADHVVPAQRTEVASTMDAAKQQASELGGDVRGQAKAVADVASEQARTTVGEARDQARRLARQAQDEVLGQVDAKTGQAATGLQSVAGQLQAIADGRPGDAGPLAGYAQQAAERVGTIAERLQQGGARGVVDDVTDFARRKPGLFLIGAVGAGFLAGRLVRSGKSAIDEQESSPSASGRTHQPSMPSTPAGPDAASVPSPGLGGDPATVAAQLP